MKRWQELARDWLYAFAPLGVLVTDKELVIRGWNHWLEVHTGKPVEEVVGRYLLEVYPDLAERGLDQLYQDALAGRARVFSQRSHRYLLPMPAPDEEGGPMMQSGQVAPLFEEGEVVGTISLIEDVTDLVRAEERLAQQADQASRRAELLETVNRVARAASSVLRLDELLETVYREVTAILPADAFFIALYDEAAGELDFRIMVDEGIREPPRRHPLGEGVVSLVIAEERPLLIREMRDWEEIGKGGATPVFWGTMRAPASWLGVPMRIGEWTIGVLCIQSYQPGAYTEEEESLLVTIADQVAVAVESARLLEEEQEQRRLAEALAEAAAALNSTLDLEQVLDRILEQVERVIEGDTYNVMAVEGEIARIVRHRGYDRLGLAARVESFAAPISRYPLLAGMMEAGEPVVVPDTAAYAGWVFLEGAEVWRSYVGAPIRIGGTTLGFLNVNSLEPNRFGPSDGRWLVAFADYAAMAMENARLYREVQTYASQLERRVAERTAELEAQYARLDAVLRSVSDGIIVTDARGEIVEANRLAAEWLGRGLTPEDAARLRKAVRELAHRAGERPREVLELTGIDLELRAAPVRGAAEAATVVAIHDVTEMKALDRMRTRFITNISHELRTPVTTVKLYAHLMDRQPGRWKEYLEPLAKEVEHLERLVEDILYVAHLDAGRQELEFLPYSLNDLVEVVVAEHREGAGERGIILEYRPADPGVLVEVDPYYMTQALSQMIRNAVLYTLPGGRVEVSTGTAVADGRVWAVASVVDTGIGIPEEELPHVFDRFFRGERPRAMQVSGTGLGLTIVEQIVSLHGGRITVQSKVGEGSAFTIWLPVAEEPKAG